VPAARRRSESGSPREDGSARDAGRARTEDRGRRASGRSRSSGDSGKDRIGHTGTGSGSLTARQAARQAARQVMELTGHEPEGVTSLARTDDGWRVGVEVVESRRVPDSTDILAVYRVDLDTDGELISYGREDRYYRGRGNKE
jgi:gas vesicle protein GvpO